MNGVVRHRIGIVIAAATVDANETSATVEEQQSCQAADLHGAAAGECLATQNTPVAAGREAREDDIGYAPSWDAAYAQRRRHEPQPCSLYFAPSTLPNAGWGLFTARPYKRLEYISASATDTPNGDYDEDDQVFVEVSGFLIQGDTARLICFGSSQTVGMSLLTFKEIGVLRLRAVRS